MAATGPYREVLMDHFRAPRNRGDLDGADGIARGSNPRCGDEIEVGIFLEDGRLGQVRFRGRGCSICIASASMMTETVGGRDREEVRHLCSRMQDCFGDAAGDGADDPPEGLQALAAVQRYPSRRRCVLLSWEALAAALDRL